MFRHQITLQLRFSDMDAFGHINNAKFLTYIEEARVKYFDEIVKWEYDWSKYGIILARVEIDYKVPGYFKDSLIVQTRCSRIGNKSLTLEYQLVKKENEKDTIISSALSVLVMYDYENGNSIQVPGEWKAAIEKFEGKKL